MTFLATRSVDVAVIDRGAHSAGVSTTGTAVVALDASLGFALEHLDVAPDPRHAGQPSVDGQEIASQQFSQSYV